MSIESDPVHPIPPRTDLLSSAIWIAVGAAIAVGSWRMDRLENLHINKYEIPGLVPGLLGAVIFLLGAALAARSVRRGALQPGAGAGAGSVPALLPVFGAMLLYPLVLVGHGLPFWLATALFVTAFIFFFDRARQDEMGRSRAKQATLALVYGVATSAVVSLVFEQVFYVRLP